MTATPRLHLSQVVPYYYGHMTAKIAKLVFFLLLKPLQKRTQKTAQTSHADQSTHYCTMYLKYTFYY